LSFVRDHITLVAGLGVKIRIVNSALYFNLPLWLAELRKLKNIAG